MHVISRKPFLFGLLLLCLWTHSAQAGVDRRAYAQDVYRSLDPLIGWLITSEAFKNRPEKKFLEETQRVYQNASPSLVFVRDSSQFIIREGEAPRLMRTPEDPQAPIFVNETLLNSESYQLNLIQLIKLYLHELGHKTGLGQTILRDHWAQEIEDLLNDDFLSVRSEDGNQTYEVLSLSPHHIQRAYDDNPMKLQPSFWIYRQTPNEISNLTLPTLETLNANTLNQRGIGAEVTVAITEIASVFSAIFKRLLEPMAMMMATFQAPGEKAPNMPQFPSNIQALSLLKIDHLTSFENELVLDARYILTRSHLQDFSMNLGGAMPFLLGGESIPLEVRLRMDSSGVQVLSRPAPTANFSRKAKVERVTRRDGRIATVEVSFTHPTYPFSADLNLEYQGGSARLRAHDRQFQKGDLYRVTYHFDPWTQQTALADRLTIDNEEVIYLDRKIEISGNSANPDPLTETDILPESIGIWGMRGSRQELLKESNHMKSGILFFLSPPESDVFVINPYNIWIEFEAREDLDLLQVELYWASFHTVISIAETPSKYFPVSETDEKGHEVRTKYTDGGTLVAQKTIRDSILVDMENIQVHPGSRPGYKKIRAKAITPLKKVRADIEENQAHGFPHVNPVGVRIVDRQLRSFLHSFRSKLKSDEFIRPFRETCQEILKTPNNPEP